MNYPYFSPSGRRPLRTTSQLLPLEQRFMFDGAVADAAHAAQAHDSAPPPVPPAVTVRAAEPARDEGKKEVVLVDTSLANHKSLEAGVRDGVGIVEFDGSRDGLAQIAQWAASQSGLDAIHILSHGSQGLVNLGTAQLNEASLSSSTTRAELAQLGQALTTDGDLLLYGCDVAAGDGAHLLAGLAQATGADVAASTDLTGAARLGGNWTLEARNGTIDARELALAQYDGVLTVVPFIYGSDGDDISPRTSIVKTVSGKSITFTGAEMYIYDNGLPDDGLYPYAQVSSTIRLTVTVQAGYSFDITSFGAQAYSGSLTFAVTWADGTTSSFTQTGINNTGVLSTVSSFNTALNDMRSVIITSSDYATFQNFDITDVKALAVAPTAVVNSAALSADTGTSASDFITRTAAQTISGTLSANLGSGERVEVSYNNGATWTNATTYTVGLNTWSTTTTLAGSSTFQARVANTGASSTAYTHTYTLDTTAPTITFSAYGLSADTGASASDFITSTAAQTISATLSGAPAGTDIVWGSVDGGSTWTNITNKVSGTALSWNGATLNAGTANIAFKVTDAAGNDSTLGTRSYTLDTTAPTTSVATAAFSNDTGTSSSDFITRTAAQTISGTLSANLASGETVYVSLNNGSTWLAATAVVGTNTWSLAGQTLTASNTLKVKVTDTAGNDGAVLSQAYVYDVTAPTITFSGVALSADTGTSNSDFITNTAAQTISATLSGAPAGTDIVWGSLDNGATWTDITNKVSGTSLSWNGVTLAASNTLRLKVTDAAGNDGTVLSQAYVLDTTAPTITFSGYALSADTGASASDFITSTAAQTISATLSGAPAGTDIVWGSVDGGSTWTNITNKVAGTSLSWNGATLNAGTANIAFKVTDAAGNDSTPGTRSYTLDTTAPTTNVATAAFSNDTGTSGSDFITNTAAQTISGTLSANLASGETVYVSLNNGSTWLAATAVVGTNTWSLAGQTLTASNTLKVKVSDTAGNDGAVLSQAYVYDVTAPTITFSGVALSADTGTSNTDFITNTAAQTISATLSGAPAGTDIVWGSLDNGATWTDITNKVSGTSLSWNGVTLAASNTLKLKVTDAAGNDGTAHSQAYVLDTGTPSTPGTPVLASDSGASNSDGITNDTTPTFTGTADNGSTVSLYDGATFLGSVVAGAGGWSYTSGTLGYGSHTITAVASDTAGNTSVPSGALVITVDNVAPATTSVAVPAGGTYYVGQPLDFTVNFDEAVTVDTGGGTPRIALVVGATTRFATYISGSGGSALVFRYVVVNGDADSDGITVGALSANGGSMKDTAGNDATVTLNSVGSTAGVDVDGSQASITGVSASTANGSYGAGQTITITVAFSGAVTVDTTGGTPTLALASGGSATYSGGSGSGTLTFTYTVAAGENSADLDYSSTGALALNGATIIETGGSQQAASVTLATPGAAGSLGANKDIVIDTAAPTNSVASAAFSADSGTSSSDFITKIAAQTISGTLSANVASDESVYVSLDNGATWILATSTVGANTWSLSGQTLAASDTLKVRVTDAAGNNGTAYSQAYVLDTSAPSPSGTPVLDSASDSGNSSSDRITSDTTPTFTGSADIGSIVSIYDGATLLGTAVAGAGGWSFTSGTLGGGSHTITAVASDTAGNAAAASGALSITIDIVAPATTSVAVPAGGTYYTGQPLDFTVNFDEAVTVDTGGGTPRIALVIGGATRYAEYLSGSGSGALVFRYVVVNGDADSDGITVGALSANGGSLKDTAGNDATVTLNSVGGTAGVDVDGSQASITGVSASTVNGSYGAGQSITITVAFSSAVTVDTTGGTPTLALASGGSATYSGGSGSSTLTFTYTVAAGENSADLDYSSTGALALNGATIIETGGSQLAASVALATPGAAGSLGANKDIIIDTAAPTTTVASAAFSADSGTSASDFITNIAAQTVSGTLSANLASSESVYVSLDNGATWTLATSTVGANTWSLASQTLTGSGTLKVKVSDAAGNDGAVYSQAYVLDNTAPTISFSGLALSADTGTAGDFITNSAAQTISATLSSAPAGGDRVYGSLDNGGTWIDITSMVSGSTLTWTGVTLAASNTLQLKVTDAAGNDGAASSQAYALDTTGPATSVASASFSADSGSSASDLITRIAAQTVSGTLSANLAAGETVYVSLDNGATWQAASGSVGSAAWTLAGQTLTGSSTLRVKVSDNAGNDSAVYTRAYVFDTSAPAAPTVTPLTTDSLAPTLTGSATLAEGESMTVTVGGATYSVTPVDGAWSLDLATAEPASGTLTLVVNHLYSVLASITDAAGNSANNNGSGELIVGSITPPTTAIGGVALSADSGASASDFITNVAAQTISGTLSAPLAAGHTVEVSFDGGATWQGTGAAAGATAWSIGVTLSGNGVFMARVSSDSGKGPVFQHAYALDTVAPLAAPTSVTVSSANVLSGGLSAPLGEGESILVSRDGGATWQEASVTGDNWFLAGVAAGTVQIQLRDAAGNTGSIFTVEAITQLVPPVVPEIPPVPLVPAYKPPVVADARPAAILPQAPVSPLSVPVLQSLTNSATLLTAFTPNDTPELSRGYDGLLAYRPIADVNVRAGERISVQLPADTFVTSGNPRVVQLSALSMDGKALPSWLKFDSGTARFEGTPPPGFEGTLSFKVMARDSRGHVAVQVFKIVVVKDGHAVKTTAIDGHVADPAGRTGFSEQMRSVRGAGADRLAALSRSAAVARGRA